MQSALDRDALHPALQDPVLSSISFLNDIMSRYPDAISFAPGAPHLSFLADFDVARYVDRYVDHLCRERGHTPDQARALLYEYGPSRGLINELVATALRLDHGVTVSPDAVVITVGAQEAMLLALRALCRPAVDLIAVVEPCFVGVLGAARLLDIGVVAISETGDGIDLDQLETACRAARANGQRIRALYIAPDFSNPSGSILNIDARRRLLDLADREEFLLLEDNAYGFTASGEQLPTLKALDTDARVIYLGTFAKVCLPGARVGFVVADQIVRAADRPERLLADEITAIKSMVTVNTSPICQAIIGGMLLEHNGSLAALGHEKATLYRRNLALLLNELDQELSQGSGLPTGVSWNRPAGGFFVRMRLPVRADLALLELSASTYGVLWTPMSYFHLGSTGDNDLRLSCSYLDPEQIEEGISRLGGFLRSLSP
jgi:(S)-3,5-dihydroxyphenylglycine transaminase